MEDRCLHCKAPLPPRRPTEEERERHRRVGGILPAAGRPRRYCSDACRKRAFRRRRAGIAVDAFPQGAARGEIEEAARAASIRKATRDIRGALRSIYEERGLRTIGGER